MPTGACGINCDVCGLNMSGLCSSCGPGTSHEARLKMEAQRRLLGAACPILECAATNRVPHCLSGCEYFPCENYESGPYPFSQGYLTMQRRRRREKPLDPSPLGAKISVPLQFWDEIRERDVAIVCDNAQVRHFKKSRTNPYAGLLVDVFADTVLVDLEGRCLRRYSEGFWKRAEYPLLELLTLVYLLNAGPAEPTERVVGPAELKEGHFFQGPHALPVDAVAKRFGADLDGFRAAAAAIGGQAVEMADAAFKILPFPKIPVYFLVWAGDDEFAPRASILFDSSVELHLKADAAWGVASLAAKSLVRKAMTGENPF